MGHQNKKDKKKNLSQNQYNICFLKQTEPPFSGEYYHHFEEGIYCCVSCGEKLFDSSTKYHSGSGWPSFYDVISLSSIELIHDTSHNMERTEVCCKNCHAHLGHVFDDGPKPTGKRWCINSLSLEFFKNGTKSMKGTR